MMLNHSVVANRQVSTDRVSLAATTRPAVDVSIAASATNASNASSSFSSLTNYTIEYSSTYEYKIHILYLVILYSYSMF